MRYSEVIRKLKKAGCSFHSHGKNHDWWYSPITGIKFQVLRHQSQEAVSRTVENISKQSGVKF